MPIARTWSGATRAGDADEYLNYLRRTGLKDYAETPGNLPVARKGLLERLVGWWAGHAAAALPAPRTREGPA